MEAIQKIRKETQRVSALPKDQWMTEINQIKEELYNDDNFNSLDNYVTTLETMINDAHDLGIKGNEYDFITLAFKTLSKEIIDDSEKSIELIKQMRQKD